MVENYPMGQAGIGGPELVEIFQNHLERFDIDILKEEIFGIETSDETEFILRGRNESYRTRSVIVATGTEPKKIEIPGMSTISKDRIYYEIKYLLPIPQDKRFVIIGGGDAVFDYALQLIRNKGKVTIMVRGPEVTCLPLLSKRVSDNKDSITVEQNAQVLRVEEAESNRELIVHYENPSGQSKLNADYLMIAIGRVPNDHLLKAFSQKSSCTIRTELNGKTNIPGLYLAGDIISGSYRQVGIAVGDGLRAAMMAAEFLKGVGHK
jgi:alkyl hydroperoxide reductase subunit F